MLRRFVPRRTRPYNDQFHQQCDCRSSHDHWWHPLQLTRRQVIIATSNFSKNYIVGHGGFSNVYKGYLPDGTLVAFKVLALENRRRASRAFVAEMETLGKVRHRNLVTVLGSSSSSQMLAIVMNYIPNGTLDEHLHGKRATRISWEQRFNIILGVSSALAYLHHDLPLPIVHCDVKPANIFLDHDMEPYLGDFGTSRWVQPPASDTRRQKFFLEPQHRVLKVTTKTDVYAYGVVVLELLTRTRPTNQLLVEFGSLAKWVFSRFPEKIEEVLDRSLLETLSESSRRDIVDVMGIALMCTADDPLKRPSMEEVISMLERVRMRGCNRYAWWPEIERNEGRVLRRSDSVVANVPVIRTARNSNQR